ncbi:hypothetical protein SAMN05444395_11714 [Flavobacterium fryxellicola]|nr:hypothetical protein SAMN05444395_11714 [Flavobacterium fryxellicola]
MLMKTNFQIYLLDLKKYTHYEEFTNYPFISVLFTMRSW